MHDFLARFRFGDFATYFLPGLVFESGVMAALMFTPFRAMVIHVIDNFSLTAALLAAFGAYFSGAIVSGSSYKLVPVLFRIARATAYKNPRESVHPTEIEFAVKVAFRAFYGELPGREWSTTHFYMARSVISERMPHAGSEAMRQNDLMRLRENMVIPVITWLVAASLLEITRLQDGWINMSTYTFLIIAAAFLILGRLVARGVDNRRREVQEVCVAFLTADKLGLLTPATRDDQRPLRMTGMMATDGFLDLPQQPMVPIRVPSSV
jgi:hypothetical protein